MGGGKRNRGQPRHSSNSSSASSVATSSVGAASLAGTSSSDTDLLSLTKEQLKIECRRRGQKTSGNKLELLQRLSHNKNMQSLHQTGREGGGSSGQNTSHNRRNKQDASTVTVNGDTRQIRRTSGSSNSSAQRQREKDERENIVLWKKPITTLDYSSRQLVFYIRSLPHSIVENLKSVTIAILSCLAIGTYVFMGPPEVRSTLMWGLYWVGLGLLSSVGFGTGLHTFILYLGPHIAKVTLAAYECGSLNFPEPPYPDEIVCPVEADPSWAVSIWNIMSKVRFEAMMWGAGTALGELPPYFMARASRLSGYDPNDEDDLREFEELQRKKREDPSSMTTLDRAKVFVERLVERVGFFGILACASIPNPLFDLAGITCGHFLVPFWTFFGATLIGKAVVKMHLQKIFVIIAFNETLIENAVSLLAFVPVIGIKLQEPFKEFLNKQKLKLHRKPGTSLGGDAENSVLASIFEKFIIAMFLYFAISIVNSLAQSYHKRLHKETKSGSRKSKYAVD